MFINNSSKCMCHTQVSALCELSNNKIKYLKANQTSVLFKQHLCNTMDPSCKTLVNQLYGEVVKDVIKNVQEHFIEEGIDQDVIQELKRTWESKILASKAVSPSHQPPTHKEDNKTVPVQIVLPAQPQSNMKQKVLIVNVPAFALQSNQLYNVLSGPVITATMSLPQPLAASLLQQHMDAAFMSRQQAIIGDSMVRKAVAQTNSEFGVNCFQDTMEIPSKPSTSGLNHPNLNKNQWEGHKNSEKREALVEDDNNLHKSKKKRMKKSPNNNE